MSISLEFNHRLDAQICRRLMLGVEPWQTLGYGEPEIDRIAEPAVDTEVIAARSGEAVVGFAVVGGAMLIGGYLRLLVVDGDMRRQGIGRRLLEAFEQRVFARWPNAYLCVSDFNTDARGFYRHEGYVEVGTLPDLLVAGHGEVLMRKSIGSWRDFRGGATQRQRES